MRSSIACIRCRRSKVKCINNGVGTTCRSCENSGRECNYPLPVPTGARRREGSVSGSQARADGTEEGGAEKRQRRRKSAAHGLVGQPSIGSRESPRPLLDALDPRLLTPTVWSELFDIFQIHYSADLPFLHPPTFLKPLRHGAIQAPGSAMPAPDANTARPPGPDAFLLAFLALTARFHPRIVAHHSPPTASRASNPLIASEYYASASAGRSLDAWESGIDIEEIQAALMLGLHEWGMCRGAKAWIRIGTAMRAAQAMGLQYELDLDDEPESRSLALDNEAERLGLASNRKSSISSSTAEGDAFIQQEIRRRTFWSCFIMDRYLSSGKYRPQMLHARELRIQLPASERSFLFAEKVRTLMLGEVNRSFAARADAQSHRQASVLMGKGGPSERGAVPSPDSLGGRDDDETKGRLEAGSEEGLVSRYIKVLEIYGKVVKWSCAGGRRTEDHPPWDHRSEWHKLYVLCHDFRASLPRQHTLTPQNTQAHISLKASTPYTLVHTVFLLCLVMLHREYVPFIPIRCSKPQGPLDPPLFDHSTYDVPPKFWEESAKECFKSARDIMDLVRTCQEWNALVETPIVGFAIYTVAFVGVYCINFPWMDPDGYMCTPPSATPSDAVPAGGSKGFEAARKALEMIGQMRPRLHMADGWFKTINRMHKYIRRMKTDYRKNVTTNEASESDNSPVSTRHLSLREGGVGGGLDEYRLLERTLKEFGNLEDQDIEMTDSSDRPSSKALDGVYDDSSAGTTVKSEEGDRAISTTEQPRQEGPWNAINNAPPQRPASVAQPPTTNGQFRSYESYHTPTAHQPQMQHVQNYGQQVNSFRPAYSAHEASVPPGGAPPSLTSPASRTASTSSAQPSPPFDPHHHHQSYNGWPPHNTAYTMGPPQHASVSAHPHQQQQQRGTPVHHLQPYPTPNHPSPQHMHPGVQHQMTEHAHPQSQQHHQPPPAQVWDQMAKEAWLNNLDTRMSGDDVAAFVDGGEMAEWATMAARNGSGSGWLTAIWGGAGP